MPAEAAPLMCAGITTFNALRHSGAMPGDLVAVQGVGGLGHLGIQFAKKCGYRVAAVGRGTQNAAIAKKLGADVYIDSAATDAAAELQKLGGARVVLATAPSGKAMSSLVAGSGSEWHARGYRRRAGPDRSVNHAVDSRQANHQGMVGRNTLGFGRYLAFR